MSEVRVVAVAVAKTEYREDVSRLVKALVSPTRKESGNQQYDLHTVKDEPGTYVFFERWESQQALEQHMKSVHFQTIGKELSEKVVSMDIKVLNLVE